MLLASAWLAPALSVRATVAFVVAFVAVCASALSAAATLPLGTWPESLALAALGALALLAAPVAPVTPWLAAVITLGLLVSCTALGGALGARVDRPGHLLAVASVSSLADLWSVLDPAGPSAKLASRLAEVGGQQLSPWVLPWPLLGSDLIVPLLGAGDVVFMALYAAVARSHGLSLTRMLTALSLGCLLALGALLVSARPLPLLPLLGASVVLLEPAARRLEGRDRRVVLLVVAGIVLVLLVRSVQCLGCPIESSASRASWHSLR